MKIESINFEKSIKINQLVFKKNFEYKFDLYFQIFVNSALLFGVIINFINWSNYGTNEKSFLIVFVIFTLFFNYLLFKKLTENKLIKIFTNFTIEENKIKIIEYLKQNDIQILRDKRNIILALDDFGNTNLFTWKKNHIVILFKENKILFTVLTERNNVNFPSLFDKSTLRNDFMKITKIQIK